MVNVDTAVEGVSALVLLFFTIRFNSLSWTMALFLTEFLISLCQLSEKTQPQNTKKPSTNERMLFKFQDSHSIAVKIGLLCTISQAFFRCVLIVNLSDFKVGVFEAGSVIPTLVALGCVSGFAYLAYLSLYRCRELFVHTKNLTIGAMGVYFAFALMLLFHFYHRNQIRVMSRNDWRLLYSAIAHIGLGLCVRYHNDLIKLGLQQWPVRVVEMLLLWYFWGATGHQKLAYLMTG
eukprot:m.38928 g.38928  ORF g.38928 m.38928 type:complete len:234 (-) comp18040_c0_seq1:91-792(-)